MSLMVDLISVHSRGDKPLLKLLYKRQYLTAVERKMFFHSVRFHSGLSEQKQCASSARFVKRSQTGSAVDRGNGYSLMIFLWLKNSTRISCQTYSVCNVLQDRAFCKDMDSPVCHCTRLRTNSHQNILHI